jgi:hypothetical protein
MMCMDPELPSTAQGSLFVEVKERSKLKLCRISFQSSYSKLFLPQFKYCEVY